MQFVTPPPQKKGQKSERWRNVVAELKANKGEWALIGNYSPGVATHIRRGKYAAFLEGCDIEPRVFIAQHWDVTTRKTDEGRRNDIYIRWLG